MSKFHNLVRFVLLIIGSATLLTQSCVEPFHIDIEPKQSYLIVEGSVTDLEKPKPISIHETSSNFLYESTKFTATITPSLKDIIPVINAKVIVIENKNKIFQLSEIEPGYYQFPLDFIGKIGADYQLFITKLDGKKYFSSIEKMDPIMEVGTLYDILNPKGIKDPRSKFGEIPTIDIYIDFVDPPLEKNFIRWTWKLYENQNICASCKQGRYQKTGESNSCVQDNDLPGANIFDYFCDGECYDIIYGNNIEIFSDAFINGQTQYDKKVAQIPLFQSNPGLLIVYQESISADAYRYFKLIQDQSINSGTIADTPQAPLKGNIENENNPEEIVLGYFTASSVYEQKFPLLKGSRVIGPYGGEKDGLFRYFNNRYAIPEIPNEKRSIIPFATCSNSLFRTNKLPL